MSVTVTQVVEAFELLFSSLMNKEFSKTMRFQDWGERDLLPAVRCFLLGYFGESLIPEAKAKLPGTLTGNGRLDFVINGVAVELAVRKPTSSKANLSATVNSNEARKLILHRGLALLVLFDFSDSPYESVQLDAFRDWPSLGKGNHKKSAFNVAYFHKDKDAEYGYSIIRKNIKVNN